MRPDETKVWPIRLAVAALLLLLGAERGMAAGAGTTGILPVTGPHGQAINPALGRAVAEEGHRDVLGPVEVQTQLAADPVVARALQRAREAMALSRERELQMKRDTAVRAAREAIMVLDAARARYHAPRLAAQARVTLGLALQLHPVDDPGTRRAFAAALRIDPGYEPAAGLLPPPAAAVFEQERTPVRVDRPTLQDMAWLADHLGLSRLAWIRIAVGGEAEVLVYEVASKQVSRIAGTIPPRDVLAGTVRLVSRALGRVRSAEHPSTKTHRTPPPPWYRKWWVWTVVGVVVVTGAGLGIGLGLQDRSSESYDLRFHF